MPLVRSQQQQQAPAHCVMLSLPGGQTTAAAAPVAVAVLSYLLFARGQAPMPLRALAAALERKDKDIRNSSGGAPHQHQQQQQSHHFTRRALARARLLVEGFRASAAALESGVLSSSFSASSASASTKLPYEKMEVLILFGPSILRPMEAFEVVLPRWTPTGEEGARNGGDGGKSYASSASSPALERLITMRLLQADLPDGPALKAATKCFVLVRGGGRGGGGEREGGNALQQQQQQPLPSSFSSSSSPPRFLPAAGFFWPRVSNVRGMLRVRIEVVFEEGGEEMEWQQEEEAGGAATTASAAATGENGKGQGGSGDAWWASTPTILGVGGCNGA